MQRVEQAWHAVQAAKADSDCWYSFRGELGTLSLNTSLTAGVERFNGAMARTLIGLPRRLCGKGGS
jgi:hypothetical protein